MQVGTQKPVFTPVEGQMYELECLSEGPFQWPPKQNGQIDLGYAFKFRFVGIQTSLTIEMNWNIKSPTEHDPIDDPGQKRYNLLVAHAEAQGLTEVTKGTKIRLPVARDARGFWRIGNVVRAAVTGRRMVSNEELNPGVEESVA